MSDLLIAAGPFRFKGRLESGKAPLTCAAFLDMLPFKEHLLHVRWSGESTWVPLGNLPSPFRPRTPRRIRSLVKYFFILAESAKLKCSFRTDSTQFGSKAGLLAGNHFHDHRVRRRTPCRPRPSDAVGRRAANHH